MVQNPDVAVIGGGIIGLTSAYFLAKAGFAVSVYDRGELGQEASWAGAGIIPPGNPDRAATPVDRLRAIGSHYFPSFTTELRELTGIDCGYRQCGAIEFLTRHEDMVPALWSEEGIAFEKLTPEQARELEPLGDVAGTPYLLPECAQVRNPWHLRALIAACAQLGIELHPNSAIEGWTFTNQRITGLRLITGNRVSTKHYLIAAGAWSNPLLAALGCEPLVHPVRGQIVLLRGTSCSRILLFGKHYLVPRGDGLTLIGSTEEPEAGFDHSTTTEAIDSLAAFARQVVPRLKSATVEAAWAGLRPGSPDGLPYLGFVPGWENVFAAAGHFRAGVQHSIATAQLITQCFTGLEPVVPLSAFALKRQPVTITRHLFRS